MGKSLSHHRRSNTASILLSAALLLALLLAASSILAFVLFHQTIPFHDEWKYYPRRLAPFLQEPFWQRIWASRSGHRLVFPGLIQKANWFWFHANLAHLIAINVGALIVSAWLLTRAAAAELTSRLGRWVLTAVVLALLLWLGQRSANWGFGLTYTLAVLGVVGACYCVHRCTWPDAAWGKSWLAGALFFALVASLSWGSGIVIWPVLVLLGLALRLSRYRLLVLFLAGAAVVTAFLIPAPGDQASGLPWPGDIHAVFIASNRALGVLGNMPAHLLAPFINGSPEVLSRWARALGGAGLCSLAGLGVVWWRSRPVQNWILPSFGVCLFVVGTALIIGLARGGNLGPASGLVPRYRIFSTLFWAALVCAATPLARRRPSLHRRFVVILAPLVLLLLLVPSQKGGFKHMGMVKVRVQQAVVDLAVGVFDPDPLGLILPGKHDTRWKDFAFYLRQHHLTVFHQPWTHWTGTRLRGEEQTVTETGGLMSAKSMPSGWRIKGYMARAHPGAIIVGVDPSGTIRALAKPAVTGEWDKLDRYNYVRPAWLQVLYRLDRTLPTMLGRGHRWYGYAAQGFEPDELRYFILRADQSVIARLG